MCLIISNTNMFNFESKCKFKTRKSAVYIKYMVENIIKKKK